MVGGKKNFKRNRADLMFDAINITFVTIILIVVIYPLYFTLVASFSDPVDVTMGRTALFVRNFTLESYEHVFKNDKLWLGYRNTLIYTAIGTAWNLVLTIPTAYVLSKKELPFRSFLSWVFLFTMYFSGGLVPSYLLVKSLGLVDTALSIPILGGLSIWNMVVCRVYFESSIPGEIYEAATIDGASDFRKFFGIALPLSVPIIAVMALFYGVTRWNDYFTALIYLNDAKLYPLQLVLRNILIVSKNVLSILTPEQMSDPVIRNDAIHMMRVAEGMKYSIIYIASAPLLIAYPFVQKYFVKGIMVGSLKG